MKKLTLVLTICLFAFVAQAATFDIPVGTLNVYGSMRFLTLFENDAYDSDIDDRGGQMALDLVLQGNSRAGFVWTADKLSLTTELGLAGEGGNAGVRLMYMGYKLGNGTLKIGQFADTASVTGYYNRKLNEDGNLDGFGVVQDGNRRPGVGYDMDNGLSINLFSLGQDNANYTGVLNPVDGNGDPIPQGYSKYRADEFVPRLDVSYTVPSVPVKVFAAFAYFTGDALDGANKAKTFSAPAYHIGVGYAPDFGAAFLRVSGFYAMNAGLYNGVHTLKVNSRYSTDRIVPRVTDSDDKASGAIDDVTTFGGALAVGYKLSDATTLELGFGYQTSSIDTEADREDDANMAIYANAVIKVAPGFSITPEIAYMDYMTGFQASNVDTEGNKGQIIQAGAQFRFDI